MTELIHLGIRRKFKKKSQIIKEGYKSNILIYVESGMTRVYYLKDGKEVTDWFGTPGTFITSINAFYDDQPSSQYVETLEDSQLIIIRKPDIEKKLQSNHNLASAYRKLTINHLTRLHERLTTLQFFSAKEKFDLLLAKNPLVVQKVSRTHIASYLGISLETLSRISKI